MAIELVWTPQARSDLIDIYVSIGRDRPETAERYFERIESRITLLAEQPRLGARRPEIQTSARMLVEFPFLVLYQTIPDTDDGPVRTVEIVRIIDGRRDIGSLV